MKKLMMLAAVSCFIFASCGNKATQDQPADAAQDAQEHKCGKEMTEEQEVFITEWNSWDNQTNEKKTELIAKRKTDFDKVKADMEVAKIDMETKYAEIEATLAKWGELTLDEQKAFFDKIDSWYKSKEGCCKDGAKKEGCCKSGEKQGTCSKKQECPQKK
ncbi:MAG: hypothetical protein RR356_00670 [Bacteroidales bacterium]